MKVFEVSRISRVKKTIFYQTTLSTGLKWNVSWKTPQQSMVFLIDDIINRTHSAAALFFTFPHLFSPPVFQPDSWFSVNVERKIKSRPNSVVTSDSRPRKENFFLNLIFTLASHARCTSCSVLVVVDSSYKKHNIFICKIVLINNTSMTAGPNIFLS